MSKKIIVTGATGQDGSYMIEYLLKNTSHEVLAAIRRTSQLIDSNIKHLLNNPRLKIVHFDLLDPFSINCIIKNEKPDYFINLGAQTFVADSWASPELHFQTNTMGVLRILEAVKNYAPECIVYNAGSSEEMGDVDYSPQDMKHPFKARSPYGASKIAARQIIKVYRESYGIFAIQGLLYNHESEKRQEYFVSRKISKGVARISNAIKNNKEFAPIELGNLDAKRDWSHAKDFIHGIWLMMNQKTPKEYILSSNETHSVREFVEKAFAVAKIEGVWHGNGASEEYSLPAYIMDIGDVKSSVLVKINPKFYRPAEVDILLGDSSLARKELNWTPEINFNELVRLMVENDLS